jgi:hypothetical protein
MKIQIDSVTFIDDHIDDDGEREIVIEQHGESVLLNADNIKQFHLIVARRLDELTCCTIIR